MEDIEGALERLRAADPAAGLDNAWAGSAAQDIVAVRTVPQPTRRRTVFLAAASAALAVAGIGFAVTELRPAASRPAGQGTTPSPVAGNPREQTDRLLAELLEGVPALPGASAASTSPVSALTDAPSRWGSPDVLEHERWWTAPGSVDTALEFYRTHPPDGLPASGSASVGNTRTGEVGPDSLYFDSPDTVYARGVVVMISVIAKDGGVAVGAYTQGVWIPERDPATLLADVTSVDVTVQRGNGTNHPPFGGAPTVHRVLSGADADRLAQVVNALPADVGGALSCPMIRGNFDDTLVFTAANGLTRVVATVTGCSRAGVTAPDGTKQLLAIGALDSTLMDVLGLPKNYGRS
jgi:hypothetical protein